MRCIGPGDTNSQIRHLWAFWGYFLAVFWGQIVGPSGGAGGTRDLTHQAPLENSPNMARNVVYDC